MRKKVRLLRILYGGMAVIFLCGGVTLFSVERAMRQEIDLLDHAHAFLLDHDPAQAETMMALLETSLWGRLRIRTGREHPYTLMLRGTVKSELGEYGEAIRYFSRSRDICMDKHVGREVCESLRTESFFRQANVSMLRWQDKAFTEAIGYFEEGLMRNFDDVFAKKSLEWLKITEEAREKAAKEREKQPGRGPRLFEKEQDDGSGHGLRKGF